MENINQTNQQASEGLLVNLNQEKTSFKAKALFTIIIYISVVLIASIIVYFFFYFKATPDGRWAISLLGTGFHPIFLIGVLGVIPLFGGSAVLFLFPFSPLVVSLLLIFVVSYLNKLKS